MTVADFPTGQELDAANGIVHEDAAIGINRKLVVDSLKASIPPDFLLYLACINAIHAYYPLSLSSEMQTSRALLLLNKAYVNGIKSSSLTL